MTFQAQLPDQHQVSESNDNEELADNGIELTSESEEDFGEDQQDYE